MLRIMASQRSALLIGLVGLMVALAFTRGAGGDDAAVGDKPRRSEEPPLEFTLTLDGKAVDIRADEPTRVKVGDREVEVRLTPKAERLLKVPGLSLRYPAGHGFDVEHNPNSTQWTLDGNDNVVIVNRIGQKVDPAAMTRATVDGLAKRLGNKNAKSSPSQMRVGGRAYPATHVDVTIRSERLTYDVCAFNAGGVTFVLMVQDTPRADGTTSDETRRVLELLDKTAKLDP
jgi:hypothetical protein